MSLTIDGTNSPYAVASGTTLDEDTLIVGATSSGELDVNDGTVNATTLDVGQSDGSTGLVEQNGGTVNDDAVIGDAGTGTYDNNNGTHDVTGNLILGNQSTGDGTYTITGESASTSVSFATLVSGDPLPAENGALVVGASGTGNFTQGASDYSDPGNTVNVAGDLVLGENAGSTGIYTLNDGTLTIGGRLVVGGVSTNNNTFTQNNGDVYVTGDANNDPNYVGVGDSDHAGYIYIGGGATIDGGTGTYTLNGGSVNTDLIEVGHDGIGTFNQTGGTVNAGIWLGNAGGAGFGGTYNLTGTGTIDSGFEAIGLGDNTNYFNQGDGNSNTTNTINGTLEIGENQGTATYTLSDGAIIATDIIVGDNYFGNNPSNGTFELDGGSVNIADTLTVGNKGGAGTVNLTGSDLSANAESIGGGGNFTVFNQNGGSNTVNGDLTVEAGGEYIYSGGSISAGNFINDGVLETTGVNADFNQDLNGTGEVLLTDGVEFSLSGQVAATQLIDFISGQTATLDTTAFNNLGTIEGFTVGDTINVTNIPNGATFDGATAQYSQNATGTGGTLAIYSGADLLTVLNFTGGYSATDFILSGNSITTNFSPTDMIVDDQVTSSPYSIDTGALTVTGNLIVGQTGNGEFDQGDASDPTNTVSVDGELVLGQRNDSNGSVSHNYKLSDGTLTVGGQISIGGSLALTTGSPGIGGFYQTGGTVNALSGIYIGVDGASGTTSTDNAFYISGGIDYVTGTIAVGELGQLDALGGTVNADNIVNNHEIDFGGGVINSSIVNNADASIIVYDFDPYGSGNITQEVTGDISGSGNIDLQVNSNLILDGTVSNGQTITFDPSSETLTVDQLTGMQATISGFSTGDVIDLNGVSAAGGYFLNYSGDSNGGTLTVTDGSGTAIASLNFTGDYDTNSFSLSNDQLTTTAPNTNVDVVVDPSTTTPVSTVTGNYNVTRNLIIGRFGAGDFTQGDGSDTTNTVTVGNDITLGQEAGSNGTYTLNDGSLTAANLTIGYQGTGTFTQYAGDADISGSVTLEAVNFASNSGTYNMLGGTLEAGSITLGYGAGDANTPTATMNQSGGAVTTGYLEMGNGGSVPNAVGIYNLTGTGTLQTNGDENIGDLGNGTFNQGDGGKNTANTVTGTLRLGAGPIATPDTATYPRSGTYNLTDGTLIAGSIIVADQGRGFFNQSGGSVSVSSNLIVGNQYTTPSIDSNGTTFGGASQGTYTQTGGTLTVDSGDSNNPAYMFVGASGSGSFVNDGSTDNTDVLVIGQEFGSTGIYRMTDNAKLNVTNNGFLDVGEQGGATFELDSGTAIIAGALDAGRYQMGEAIPNSTDVATGTGIGTIYIHGGSLSIGTFAQIGYGGNSTVTQDGSSLFQVNDELDIGVLAGSSGAYSIAGTGTLSVVSGPIVVGDAGTGSLTIGTEGVVSAAPRVLVESTGGNANVTIGNAGGGTLTVHSGTLSITNNLNIGVNALGTAVQDGGTVDVNNLDMSSASGTGSSTYALSGGTLSANFLNVGGSSSGTAAFTQSGSSVVGSETVTIAANGTYNFNDGTFSASGIYDYGTLAVSGTNTISAGAIDGTGNLNLVSGANFTLSGGTIGSSVIINFETGTDTLSVADQVGMLGTITGFSGDDVINLLNQNFTSADHVNYVGNSGDPTSGGVLTITDASNNTLATLDFTGDYTTSVFVASGTSITICFYPGTRVSTLTGDVEVEKLAVGDLVATLEGELKPIRWIGRQTISRVFADPLRVLPIRITAGALGENLPCRDLLVSPDHALLVEGVLVNASALVNDVTIVRETNVPMSFTYYHVELADHSLILAENVPAETFVDNVDRMNFDNWDEHEALYPNGYNIPEMAYPRAKSYRQMPLKLRQYLASLITEQVVDAA